jgi:hypothetical protein
MNRRQFLVVFGGTLAALQLPDVLAHQLPEEIPDILPPLPIGKIRLLQSFSACGTGTIQRCGQVAIARIPTKQCLILHALNAYGGSVHTVFRPGEEIVEAPGQEVAIASDGPDISWSAVWRDMDGGYDVTAGIGKEYGVSMSIIQPKILFESNLLE